MVLVEIDHANLGVQENLCVPGTFCLFGCCCQQSRTDALATVFPEYGHAADLSLWREPGSGNRNRVESGKEMRARYVGTVPFQFFGHMLLIDENRFANRLQRILVVIPVDDTYFEVVSHTSNR